VSIAGAVLLIVGFVLVAPRGITPGSIAARNVGLRGHSIHQTPGYQESTRNQRVWVRLIGVAVLVAGVALVAIGA
jgi:hypothetical protein